MYVSAPTRSDYFYRLGASFYEATCRYGNGKGNKAAKPCTWYKEMACRFAADSDGSSPLHDVEDVDIDSDTNWTIAGDFDDHLVAPDDDAVLDGSSSGGGSGDGDSDR